MTVVATPIQVDPQEEQTVRKLIIASGCPSNEVDAKVQQYKNGEPLAYITGEFKSSTTLTPGNHNFGTLSLTIRPPVYIPRVETEQWVLLVAEAILSSTSQSTFRILDICSGSGCIPLLLAKQGGGRIQTVGLEVDDRALAVARENAERNEISHLSTFEKFDLFEDDVDAFKQRIGDFDMVVSNPPYVSSADMKDVEGKWWEGKFALQGKLKDFQEGQEDDGLSFYRRIKDIYTQLLSPTRPSTTPKLVLEVGSKQSPPVKEMFAAEGRLEVQKETERRKDLSTPKLEHGDMVGTERSIWIYGE
ncbi:hypothetical protein IAU60_004910 [Kwoniella sp. DSM 27419]